CELYELGKPTYKKLRLAVLLEQRQGLIDDVCGNEHKEEPAFIGTEYIHMLQNIKPVYLSPSELHEVSMRLCEVSRPPTTEYYQNYFQALLDAKQKLGEKDIPVNGIAIKRIDDKIASHARDFYLYLKANNRQQDIENFFDPAVYSKEPAFNWNSGIMPLKTGIDGKVDVKAMAQLAEYSTAQTWKASIQLMNHQIKKLSVNERHINSASERWSHASTREAFKTVTINDLEQANVVSFTSGFSRTDNIKIEINVGGRRKEIDKATFFRLVVARKEALTNPKVIGLLDYLRNASPVIEKRYAKEVYPSQRNAFMNKLEENTANMRTYLASAITQLTNNKAKLMLMITQSQQNIDVIASEMTNEQQAIGQDKHSVKFKNLELRKDLLLEEQKELQNLMVSVTSKIEALNAPENVKGSSNYKLATAQHTIEQLKAKDSDLKSINDVSNAFTSANLGLEQVQQHLENTINLFEVEDVEREANNRAMQINQYREKAIVNHLEANAEYRILDELSAGRMGTEKDRNRALYAQTPEESTDFYKQGKNSYLEGSVFQEIQNLNKKLKAKATEVVERSVLLTTKTFDASTVDALASANDDYVNIGTQAQELSKKPIPTGIKKQWVREMFAIWLKHQSPEALYHIQQTDEPEPTVGITQAFHQFLEQKANIKYAALKEAGYPIELSVNDIKEMGWTPIGKPEIEATQAMRKKKVGLISERFKAIQSKVPKLKEARPVAQAQLTSNELTAQHDSTLTPKAFTAPDAIFLAQHEKTAIDGSTLEFLRKNPMPNPKGTSQGQCATYFKDIGLYLHLLKEHKGLENKSQRIAAFCHASASKIFNLPHPPPKTLLTELMTTMMARYRDDEGFIKDSFVNLENKQRTQILSTLIKLNLLQITTHKGEKTKVDSKFYSTIKQWEKLISPPDKAMSAKISMLAPGGTLPEDVTVLKEVDNALHESPIGLEGLYEGQEGLQMALTTYGNEKGVDEQLRKLADRLGFRNGSALLPQQFLAYYSNPKFMLSADGINSTQGRELFSRALLDAVQHGTEPEKHELLNFLQALQFAEKDGCKLKTPHEVFIDESLMKCANIDAVVFSKKTEKSDATASETFIATLTDSSSTDGVDRLFGFAKEVNLVALKIEQALHQKPINQANLDQHYSQFICSNLAYQLILDQASQEILSGMSENFEYTREMALAQSNINKLQDN
ncbi:MAG: hypothetical protein ACHP65_09295, partial [Legionellales bacterium]